MIEIVWAIALALYAVLLWVGVEAVKSLQTTASYLSFITAAAIVSGADIMWVATTEQPLAARLFISAIIGMIALVSLSEGVRYGYRSAAGTAEAAKKSAPDLAANIANNGPSISSGRDVNIGQIGDVTNNFTTNNFNIPKPGPQDFGKLDVILDTGKTIATRNIEIGDSGSVFMLSGPGTDHALSIFKTMRLKLETIDGKLKVSTQVKNDKGKLVAELIENEWKVSASPTTWDRNYNNNTLEVKNDEGRIILQVRLLPDRIRLQGEWWDSNGEGFRLVKSDIPERPGGLLMKFGPGHSADIAPYIVPLFKYPSNSHFGELR